MSFSDKILNIFDGNTNYTDDICRDIKGNIASFLNSKLDENILNEEDSFNLVFANLDIDELCEIIGRRVFDLITKYEKRVRILNISYDSSKNSHKLTFYIDSLYGDRRNLNIKVIFHNNRYCEVI